MATSSDRIEVYLEVGAQRTFAGALDWPGWCRAGSNEGAALQALFDYAPRYQRILSAAGIDFIPPADVAALDVVERLEGNTTTDFGAPGVAPAADEAQVDDAELARLQMLLQACWQALDATARRVTGKELRKGPRGGGRELVGVLQHVLGGDLGYLRQLGGKVKVKGDEADLDSAFEQTRQAILDTLAASARGEIPRQGPRGGNRWTPRYYVRRAAWHILDHAWELEDRAE